MTMGELKIEPAPELESLRYDECRHTDLKVSAARELTLDDIRGDSLELRLLEVELLAAQKEFASRCAVRPMLKNKRPSCFHCPNRRCAPNSQNPARKAISRTSPSKSRRCR